MRSFFVPALAFNDTLVANFQYNVTSITKEHHIIYREGCHSHGYLTPIRKLDIISNIKAGQDWNTGSNTTNQTDPTEHTIVN